MHIDAISAEDLTTLAKHLKQRAFSFVSIHANCELGFAHMPKRGAVHGATSCLGAMTHQGVHGGVAAFVIDDADGAYGTAVVEFGDTPYDAAAYAVTQALMHADRPGETPDLVWLSATPGTEEAVLKGIESVVGEDVPIIGGSAADNSVEGNWYVFDHTKSCQSGLVVSVLFPSTPISFAYQNGYTPTDKSGVVTEVNGRTITTIDHRPAMEVYAEWTDGAVAAQATLTDAQAILSQSTLWPLGREVTKVSGVPFYLLAHPAVAQPNGEIDLFANVEKGEILTSMSGTIEGLTARAGRVSELAKKLGSGTDRPIAGALMIYCGGCMLSVRDALSDVVDGVNAALGPAPFLGAFTFGEQGSLLDAGNRHGNLMISCIVFESA